MLARNRVAGHLGDAKVRVAASAEPLCRPVSAEALMHGSIFGHPLQDDVCNLSARR